LFEAPKGAFFVAPVCKWGVSIFKSWFKYPNGVFKYLKAGLNIQMGI
jgi:hypothetical protein